MLAASNHLTARQRGAEEMGSPSYRLAAAITVPSTGEFLVVRQPRPPSPPAEDEDYRRFVDSDLYDLPSAPLKPLAGEPRSEVAVSGADSVTRLDLSRLDVSAALDQVSYLPISLSSSCFFSRWLFCSTGKISEAACHCINFGKHNFCFLSDFLSIWLAGWNAWGVAAPEVRGGSRVWPRCWS